MLPHNTPDWHNFSYYMVTLTHKKGAGVCSFAHPGILGLRIASPHRIDNAVSPRQNALYKIGYIETLNVTLRLSSVCCGYEVAKFKMHNDRRSKTSFSYIRPPAAHKWTNKRWRKDRKKK